MITLSQALEGFFIAARAKRLSPNTLAQYDWALSRFETFAGSDHPLAEISPADIRAYLSSLDSLSKTSVLHNHSALSALWSWAVQEGVVTANPVREVQPPRPEEREIVPYTLADVQALLHACEYTRAYARPGQAKCRNQRPTALRDRALLLVLLDTGLRVSEVCSLRIYQADLKNQRIVVMGKGAKERAVPFCERTAQAIWRYLATRDDGGRGAEVLFAGENSQGLSRYGVARLICRLGQRAGVPGANVHRFRHTFAVEFLRNGGNIYALQRLLGHSSLSMVRRYLHLVQADVENAHRHASPVANWVL